MGAKFQLGKTHSRNTLEYNRDVEQVRTTRTADNNRFTLVYRTSHLFDFRQSKAIDPTDNYGFHQKFRLMNKGKGHVMRARPRAELKRKLH